MVPIPFKSKIDYETVYALGRNYCMIVKSLPWFPQVYSQIHQDFQSRLYPLIQIRTSAPKKNKMSVAVMTNSRLVIHKPVSDVMVGL